jgi:hypothetical protein
MLRDGCTVCPRPVSPMCNDGVSLPQDDQAVPGPAAQSEQIGLTTPIGKPDVLSTALAGGKLAVRNAPKSIAIHAALP